MYNRNFGVATLDFASIEERLKKSGVYMQDDKKENKEGNNPS